jgi:hypothetical protein
MPANYPNALAPEHKLFFPLRSPNFALSAVRPRRFTTPAKVNLQRGAVSSLVVECSV